MWSRGSAIEPPRRRRLDLAIKSSALASVAFIALFLVTARMPRTRLAIPFTDGPYETVASVSVLVLAAVLMTTGIRALRHWRRPAASGWEVTSAIETRIRVGLLLTLLLVSGPLAVNALGIWSLVELRGHDPASLLATVLALAGSSTRGPLVLVGLLVGLAATATVFAWLALARAWPRRRSGPGRGVERPWMSGASAAMDTEPDTIDDLLVLGGLQRRPLAALATTLDRAAWSPRRHRLVTGLIVAGLAGLAGSGWHGLDDGAATVGSSKAILFSTGVAAAALVGYGLAVWPLHALRRAG